MVIPTTLPVSLLVIADSNFINICNDPNAYLEKLKNVVEQKRGKENVVLYTVPGKYGISSLDKEMDNIPVQDKNKTVFMQTLENMANMFDELLIVSIAEEDIFIKGAKEVMTTLNKSFTHYRYARK